MDNRKCFRIGCPDPPTIETSGWLLINPVVHCEQHSKEFVNELKLMGWTFPIGIRRLDEDGIK